MAAGCPEPPRRTGALSMLAFHAERTAIDESQRAATEATNDAAGDPQKASSLLRHQSE
jgi:hypothetical protein